MSSTTAPERVFSACVDLSAQHVFLTVGLCLGCLLVMGGTAVLAWGMFQRYQRLEALREARNRILKASKKVTKKSKDCEGKERETSDQARLALRGALDKLEGHLGELKELAALDALPLSAVIMSVALVLTGMVSVFLAGWLAR